jgi:hypothetical protein
VVAGLLGADAVQPTSLARPLPRTLPRLLQESVVLPCRHPQLFMGLLAPWMGVLLYGPPGTGACVVGRWVGAGASGPVVLPPRRPEQAASCAVT